MIPSHSHEIHFENPHETAIFHHISHDIPSHFPWKPFKHGIFPIIVPFKPYKHGIFPNFPNFPTGKNNNDATDTCPFGGGARGRGEGGAAGGAGAGREGGREEEEEAKSPAMG